MPPREKGTMRQEQAAETRRKLLASARKLFAERGYNSTPVRDINREINMADGLLYHYFPGGKREILQVLMQESFESAEEGMRYQAEEIEKLSLPEVLERVYQLSDGLFTDNIDLLKILIRDCNALDPDMVEKIVTHMRTRQSHAIAFLKRRHEKGEIREMDFEMAANQLLSITLCSIVGKIANHDLLHLGDPEHRKRLVAYTMALWRTP